MFLDMAHTWNVLAAKIDSAEALDQTADPTEPYRFGSRIVLQTA
jgi:hypothetical protein